MKLKTYFGVVVGSAILMFMNSGCSSSSTSSLAEDSSPSGAAAASVGGVLSSSVSGGTVSFNRIMTPVSKPIEWLAASALQKAFASTTCPTILTANGSGCTTTSGKADITYSACSFGSSLATWTGILRMSLGTGSVSCGTFPSPVSTTINRQFVDGSGTATSGSRTSSSGTVVTIDHSSSNLSNYQSDVISANIGSGYGSQVTFDGSGARTGVTVKQRIYSTGRFDHTINGTLTVSESGTTRTVSGTVATYHNLIEVKGTTTFGANSDPITYNNTCCLPVSGTITTLFAKTSASPTNLITAAINGKTETLTFTGCGTATLTAYSGTSTSVSMTNCY